MDQTKDVIRMEKRKLWYRRFLCVLLLGTVFSTGILGTRIIKEKSTKALEASFHDKGEIYACGFPVGIYMDTQGILVVDYGKVWDTEGKSHSPSEYLLMPGDYIQTVNGKTIENKKQLIKLVKDSQGKDLEMEVVRENKNMSIKVTPVEAEDGTYKLGVWVRDNVQGIGTMTFMDENGRFGALGHGISDVDLGEELKISKGKLYQASILAIQKGTSGIPGELKGAIDYQNQYQIGQINHNSGNGITGQLFSSKMEKFDRIPCSIGHKEDIKPGEAVILCDIGDGVKKYSIDITKINWNMKDTNKCFEIKVTDEELIGKTGGIIRGMSGAPILQNGKLIGAVTHVFVQDSTRGYGIFIENMLDTAE